MLSALRWNGSSRNMRSSVMDEEGGALIEELMEELMVLMLLAVLIVLYDNPAVWV